MSMLDFLLALSSRCWLYQGGVSLNSHLPGYITHNQPAHVLLLSIKGTRNSIDKNKGNKHALLRHLRSENRTQLSL